MRPLLQNAKRLSHLVMNNYSEIIKTIVHFIKTYFFKINNLKEKE